MCIPTPELSLCVLSEVLSCHGVLVVNERLRELQLLLLWPEKLKVRVLNLHLDFLNERVYTLVKAEIEALFDDWRERCDKFVIVRLLVVLSDVALGSVDDHDLVVHVFSNLIF